MLYRIELKFYLLWWHHVCMFCQLVFFFWNAPVMFHSRDSGIARSCDGGMLPLFSSSSRVCVYGYWCSPVCLLWRTEEPLKPISESWGMWPLNALNCIMWMILCLQNECKLWFFSCEVVVWCSISSQCILWHKWDVCSTIWNMPEHPMWCRDFRLCVCAVICSWIMSICFSWTLLPWSEGAMAGYGELSWCWTGEGNWCEQLVHQKAWESVRSSLDSTVWPPKRLEVNSLRPSSSLHFLQNG